MQPASSSRESGNLSGKTPADCVPVEDTIDESLLLSDNEGYIGNYYIIEGSLIAWLGGRFFVKKRYRRIITKYEDENSVQRKVGVWALTVYIVATLDVYKRQEYKTLPEVLSRDEVKRILSCLTNRKHHCMISLIDSAGLRRSELLNLTPQDIVSERMLVSIMGKGQKCRYSDVYKRQGEKCNP